MLWADMDDGGSGSGESMLMLMWYYGTVERIKDRRWGSNNKRCVAAIKWEVGGDVVDKK